MVLLLRIFSALVLVTHGHLRSESIGSVWTTGSNEISNETFDVIQTKTNYTEKTKSIGFMNTDAPVSYIQSTSFFLVSLIFLAIVPGSGRIIIS